MVRFDFLSRELFFIYSFASTVVVRRYIRLIEMLWHRLHLLVLGTATALLSLGDALAQLTPSPFTFGFSNGVPVKINWHGETNRYYDLWSSTNLSDWAPVDGFPKPGAGTLMEEYFEPADRQFFRMASGPDSASFLLPEVAAYKAATGITQDAANEINLFLRNLRGAGVEPVLFWVGGTRYNSINGSNVRAVIGGNGSVVGSLGVRGERYETFSVNRALRFPNPLKQLSQSRVGLFAGAAPASDIGVQGLISGGENNPRGPLLVASWSGGNFRVFSTNGNALPHSGAGEGIKADSFLPYVGGAYDGSYSVLAGLGKTAGSRQDPLRYQGFPQPQFSRNEFVNYQDYVDLGGPYLTGKLYFAVITAADLTDNRRAYELISIPRRSGFGAYGLQTAVVFLGDSIVLRFNGQILNSDGQTPPHKAGGQWNRNSLGLIANATGEGNDAQIEYFEKAAKFALDTRTWDHVFYVCGSGGHYIYADHMVQNPLTQEAKDSVDAWIREYHEHIAIPAAELGATVLQMTYVYGCPQNDSPARDPEIFRVFMDYFTAKQREIAQAAGFLIFDVYGIPQLHEPLPAFYSDQIHPNAAGNRLIAQEFAATVANPGSRIPRALSRPIITGSPKVGTTLKASKGSWAFTPTYYSYQWMREATDIPGATASSYTVTTTDINLHISCRLTASNSYGAAERTSGHTLPVMP